MSFCKNGDVIMQVRLLILFLMLLVNVVAFGHTNYAKYLTPGARLLAGNVSKNEFFILDKNEQPHTKPLLLANHGKKKLKRIHVVSKHYDFKPHFFVNKASHKANNLKHNYLALTKPHAYYPKKLLAQRSMGKRNVRKSLVG